jgi:hypothetical protein
MGFVGTALLDVGDSTTRPPGPPAVGLASPGPPEEAGVAPLGEAAVVSVVAAGGEDADGAGSSTPPSWAFAAEASVTTKTTVQKEATFMGRFA